MALLTERDLDEQLNDLVEWERFGLYLPDMTSHGIEKISKQKDSDCLKKLALFKEWLKIYPYPAWEDVIMALEKVGENTLASKIKQKTNTCSSLSKENQQASANKVKVSKQVIDELDKMHRQFTVVTQDVKKEVETAVDNGSMSIKDIVSCTMEERAFCIPDLLSAKSVQNPEEYFKAIYPFYSFLNCYLIIRLAVFLSGCIANRAEEYEKKVDRFKETNEVRLLRDNLDKYLPNVYPDKVQVIVQLEKTWGRYKIWLVEELLKEMFDLRSRDQCMWFRVKPGSEVLTFLLPKNLLMLLIVNCAKKIEFMELMGVIRLQVGCVVVLKKEEDVNFCFENSLIHAAETMNFEVNFKAAEFLLQFFDIDVNRSRTVHAYTSITVEESYIAHMSIITRLNNHQAMFNTIWEDMCAAVQTNPYILDNLKAIVREERPSYSLILNQVQNAGQFIHTIKSFHNFLNYSLIMKIAKCLRGSISSRLILYGGTTDTFKTMVSIAHLNQYFLTSQPEGTVKISILLANVWQSSSIVMVEKLVQKIFKLKHPDECPWFRVIIGSVLAVFIAPKHMKKNLIDTSKKKAEFMKLIGIISLKIGDEYVIKEANNDDYTFKVGMEEAKSQDKKDSKETEAKSQDKKDSKETEAESQDKKDSKETEAESQDKKDSKETEAESQDKKDSKETEAKSQDKKDSKETEAESQDKKDSKETLKFLTEVEADIAAITCQVKPVDDINGNKTFAHDGDCTPLMIACGNADLKLVKLLLEKSADPNIETKGKSTALIYAALSGSGRIVKMLIDHNVDIDKANAWTETALSIACCNGCANMVKMLLARKPASLNYRDKNGITPLLASVRSGHLRIVQMLLGAKADFTISDKGGQTPLFVAVNCKHLDIVKCLLEANADPDVESELGATCLVMAISQGDLEMFNCLLKAKANPNIQQSTDGISPLYAACMKGNLQISKVLISAKANPNVQDHIGNTPLHTASENGYVGIVECLIAARADLNAHRNDGITPLLFACAKQQLKVVRILLKAGTDPDIPISSGGITALHAAFLNNNIPILKLLLQHNADPNYQDPNGMTVLHTASVSGNLTIVKLLLKAGAFTHLSPNGLTPLHLACINGHTEIVKELIKHTDLNIVPINGDTPLLCACLARNVEIATVLLKAKANPNIRSEQGTPLQVAMMTRNTPLIRLLREHGATT